MSPERHRVARQIFEEALQQPEAQRTAFLAAACRGDRQIAQEAERLLDAGRQAKSFLEEDTRRSLRIGRYIVTGELGRGAMGVVYRATDPQIGREVAVKVIQLQSFTSAEESDELRERLLREAHLAGKLSHPGIVVVYDAGTDNRMPYIVMEIVDGPSLLHVLEAGPRMDAAEALDILRQAAGAMDYAHQCKVVHRDIKPANIMLHRKNQVKIADFGIARNLLGPKYTTTGAVMGTPEYMSPEQIEGQPANAPSDQFSLAAVAYELLTGVTPFHGGSFRAIAYGIVAGPRPSAHKANPALPIGVDEVLRRGLAQLPEQRYATCSEFVHALEEALPSVQKAVVRAEPGHSKRWRYVLAGVVALVLVSGAAVYGLRHAMGSPTAHQSPPAVASGPGGPVAAPPPVVSENTGSLQPPANSAPAEGLSPVPTDPVPTDPVPADAPPRIVTQPGAKIATAIPANPQGAQAPVAAARSGSLEQPPAKLENAPSSPAGFPAQTSPAVPELRRSAESGNTAAMDKLGQVYERGGGVPPSPAEAFRWYSKAGAAGDASALYHLGKLYETGDGTVRNLNEAVRLYQKAAAAGSLEAKARLSQLPAAAVRPPPNTAATNAPIPLGAISIRVPARVPWTDTGINLYAGDSVTVTASGLVAIDAEGRIPPKAPGGFAPNCAAAASIYGGQFGILPAPQLPCWSLIARVGGNGMILEVGSKGAFQVRSNGRLLLGINDDTFVNHAGFWTAAVTVQRPRTR